MAKKRRGRAIHGILLLDKPLGISSNAALQQAKRLYHAQKAGHTGSLDNLATGLLPVCFGEATKLASYVLNADKTYHAVCRLGQTSTTGDAEGEIIQTRPTDGINQTHIETVLSRFIGEIEQIPPMYSALKHQGQPLYKLARQGKTIERAARRVRINRLALTAWQGDELSFEVDCSKGTYVRTLAEDIGAQLGCGAHLIALRRTRVAQYQNMFTLEALQVRQTELGEAGLDALLLPCETAIAHWDKVILEAQQAHDWQHGGQIAIETTLPCGQAVSVFQQGTPPLFLGLGEIGAGGAKLAPRKVFQW